VCVATSPATEEAARALGLQVQPFDILDSVDLAVDGADQVAPDLWLIKGGGGAHTREKIVAAAATRFVVIVSANKIVERLGPPVPIEVLRFGYAATLRVLSGLGAVEPRESPPTPEGNVVVDFMGAFDDPRRLAAEIDSIPGVVGHGLFGPELVSEVIVGKPGSTVERRTR
jgi:ribose 5-phosphate isomerase A